MRIYNIDTFVKFSKWPTIKPKIFADFVGQSTSVAAKYLL